MLSWKHIVSVFVDDQTFLIVEIYLESMPVCTGTF